MSLPTNLIKLHDNLLARIRHYASNNFTAFVLFWHLVFAAFFFSPYFLFNYVLLANLDMPNFNIPMLILAKKDFWHGSLGLWNPYLLGGISSLLSAQAPIYNIIDLFNWILFVVPDKYLLLAGTFLPFVKFWLIGVFAYFIFYEEIQSKKWAFFAATTYQLSGYTLWNMLIFELTSMWLWITAAIYLIWTAYKRKAYLNYILLTVVLIQLVLPSYIIVVIYAFILLGILALYRYFSQRTTISRVHHLFTSLSALGTGALIFMLRMLPTWAEARQTSRVTGFIWDFDDLSFLGLRLFNPEVLGVNFLTSYQIINGTTNQFKDIHIHAYMPQFFGVLPALLLLWAIVSSQKGRSTFWLVYTGIIFATLIRLEPFDTIARVLLHPVHHPQGLQIFLPIGVCALVGLTAKNLEKQDSQLSITPKTLWLFIFLVLAGLGYIVVIWLPQFSDQVVLVGVGLVALAFIGILIGVLYYWRPTITLRILSILGYGGAVLLLVLSLYYLLFVTDLNKTFVSHIKNISTSILILASIYLGLLVGIKNSVRLKVWAVPTAMLLLAIFFFVAFYPWTDVLFEQLSKMQDFQLAMLGTVRFIVVSATFTSILYFLKQKKLQKQWLFPLLFLILIFDLLPSSKIHGFLLNNPFYKDSTLYPAENFNVVGQDGSPLELDTKNYRINKPHAMLQLPYYREYYGSEEYLSVAFAAYGIRSYGGYYNGLPNHYRKFIATMAPSGRAPSHGLYLDVKNERFLDLAGVRYDYDPRTGTVKIRPKALSRFTLFNAYEVIEDDEEALERLRDPQFSALETVILNSNPGIRKGKPGSSPAKKLAFIEKSSELIEVNVNSEKPGIVFFNDTYHPDWKAYVNGKEKTVLQAHYNFMAVAVPAGQSKVVFRFQPSFFRYGLIIAGIGIFLFAGIGAALYIVRDRLDPKSSNPATRHIPFKSKIKANFRTFKIVYLSFIFLLLVAFGQALFNYHYPSTEIDRSFRPAVAFAGEGYEEIAPLVVQTIEVGYEKYNIMRYHNKFYALPRTLEGVDLTKIGQGLLDNCFNQGVCIVADTLEEAKQLVDKTRPEVVVENYKGFNVVLYKKKYYVLDFQAIDPEELTNLDENRMEEYRKFCDESALCAGITETVDEARLLADQLDERRNSS